MRHPKVFGLNMYSGKGQKSSDFFKVYMKKENKFKYWLLHSFFSPHQLLSVISCTLSKKDDLYTDSDTFNLLIKFNFT
jgi:hypothetical protein